MSLNNLMSLMLEPRIAHGSTPPNDHNKGSDRIIDFSTYRWTLSDNNLLVPHQYREPRQPGIMVAADAYSRVVTLDSTVTELLDAEPDGLAMVDVKLICANGFGDIQLKNLLFIYSDVCAVAVRKYVEQQPPDTKLYDLCNAGNPGFLTFKDNMYKHFPFSSKDDD